jgi:hypothetical protein
VIDAETPQQVVQFYGNVDYAMDVIKNRQIAVIHISMLNDPFDPYYFLSQRDRMIAARREVPGVMR